MLHIGCHLSATGGFLNMGETALSINADTFAFFTRNPRGGTAKELDPDDAAALVDLLDKNSFAPLVAHAPYTLNLCSDKENIRTFAFETMKDDIMRMEYVPGNYYNFHPGSHMKQGTEAAVGMIADALNNILFEGMHTTVLLETMAGKGTEVGRSFEELRMILDRVDLSSHMGVCLDTCHVYDAGYDIVNGLDGVLDEFDRIIGLSKLKAIDINDSKNPMGSHKDRHERIGFGSIGNEAFKRIINHPALRSLPFILETPNELPGYAEEINLLRSLQDN